MAFTVTRQECFATRTIRNIIAGFQQVFGARTEQASEFVNVVFLRCGCQGCDGLLGRRECE